MRLPSPLTRLVFPSPLTTCTLTPENWTVGLPSIPEATYPGRSTAVFLAGHDALAPVPPEVAVAPAVSGTHNHVTAPADPTPNVKSATLSATPARPKRLRTSTRFIGTSVFH